MSLRRCCQIGVFGVLVLGMSTISMSGDSKSGKAEALRIVVKGKEIVYRAIGCITKPHKSYWIVVPEKLSAQNTCDLVTKTVFTAKASSFYLTQPLKLRAPMGAGSGFPVKGAEYEVNLLGANFSDHTVNGTGWLKVMEVRGRKVEVILDYQPTDWDQKQGVSAMGGRFSLTIDPALPEVLH